MVPFPPLELPSSLLQHTVSFGASLTPFFPVGKKGYPGRVVITGICVTEFWCQPFWMMF